MKIESSFSTAAAGEDGTSIKRQPKVKVEKGQSDGKAAVGKAEPVSLEEIPAWLVAGFTFCLFALFGWDRQLEHLPT